MTLSGTRASPRRPADRLRLVSRAEELEQRGLEATRQPDFAFRHGECRFSSAGSAWTMVRRQATGQTGRGSAELRLVGERGLRQRRHASFSSVRESFVSILRDRHRSSRSTHRQSCLSHSRLRVLWRHPAPGDVSAVNFPPDWVLHLPQVSRRSRCSAAYGLQILVSAPPTILPRWF